MIWIVLSAIACTLLFIVVIIIIVWRKPKLDGSELVKVSETPETGIMGVLSCILCYALLIMKSIDSTIGGTDLTSYKFVATFALICAMCGYEVLLFAYMKKVIAYEDRIECYNQLGIKKVIYWNKITEVKVSVLSKRATFKTKDDGITVNGSPVSYVKFIKLAKKKVSPMVASDDLGKLYSRINHNKD